jgi:hypothetical protein
VAPNVDAALQHVGYEIQQNKQAAAMLYQQEGLTESQKSARISARLQAQLQSGVPYHGLNFTWDTVEAALKQQGFSYLYVTDDGADGSPWDRLPAFFWQLF